MGFRMIEPWKHPRSNVLWFRRRVPEKFVALMGRREIKFSLGTADMNEARLRCNEENLKLERTWQDYAEGRPRGRDLDYRQVVALAGEFYSELIEKHQSNPGKADAWEASMERDRKLRKQPHFPLTRPQHQRIFFGTQVEAFLASKGLTLTPKTFDTFLREFLDAKAQAEGVLARNARGDFSPDRNADRFPEWTPVSNEQRLPGLWKEFVADRQVSRGTQKKYKGILDALVARVGTDDMSAVTEGHLSAWIDELKKKRSRKTVKEGYAAALKSFFGWAKRNKKLPSDPAADIFVEPTAQAPEKKRGFNDAEASLILAATLAPVSHLMTPENAGARRWVPWLRFPDWQLEQPCPHHLRELRWLGSESLRNWPFLGRFLEAWKDCPGRA
jgi:Phage integrase, N-terminal SAM-like domain